MEEKKEIKVKLSTVIYLIIIIALVVALGVTYYFGFVVNKSENIDTENVANLNNNEISNIDLVEKENNTEENKVEENKTETSDVEKSEYTWEKYPKNFRKNIAKWILGDEDVDAISEDLPKTLYSLSKKYSDYWECPFYRNYDNFVLADGDITEGIDVESNYSQYTYKTSKIKKYSKSITYKIATFNKALYYDDEAKTLEEKTASQYADLKSGKEDYHYEDIPKDRKFYYEIPAMLVMNGNNTSEKDYKNNSRAKKIKVTINEDKEYIFELKDTNAVQVFDIDYKQNTIENPVNIKIEVLEKYIGEKTEDVYISDIQFSIASNIPQGL